MKCYKILENGYIVAIGVDTGGTEITPEEYAEIKSLITDKPQASAGCDYHLRNDLTWELYELPAEETDPELTAEEALDIIIGGGSDA